MANSRRAAATKESVAYDYSRLTQREQQQLQQSKQTLQVHQGGKKARIPYGKYAAIFGGVFAALFVIVFSYMQVAVLTGQNAAIRDQLEELKSDENALNAKTEQIFNLSYVEDRAKNVLGMVKAESSQMSYVDLSKGDVVEIDKNETQTPQFISNLVKSFQAVVSYLK